MFYPIYIQNQAPERALVISLPGLRGPIRVNSILDLTERVQALCNQRKRKMPVPPKDLEGFALAKGLKGGWWFWMLIDVDE